MSDIMTVQGLDLWSGDQQALHDISMNIPEKSITALIGPSGCGKSTFLKTLNRMNDLIPGVKITGDVFASALCGALMNGKTMPRALEDAAKFCDDCVQKTVKRGEAHWYSLAFEDVLKEERER